MIHGSPMKVVIQDFMDITEEKPKTIEYIEADLLKPLLLKNNFTSFIMFLI